MSEGNVATVQSIYEAFGSGDIPAILDRPSPDVRWDEGFAEDGPPWLRPRVGREGVGEFFASLGELEFGAFRPYAFLADGPYVVALLHVELTIKATGRSVVNDAEGHLWAFDDDGRVAWFRHMVDTHAHRVAAG